VVTTTLDRIAAGAQQIVAVELPAARTEAFWAEGPQYWVAEIDFTDSSGPNRLFVTRLVP